MIEVPGELIGDNRVDIIIGTILWDDDETR
jgi:hypothetical protein